MDEEVEINGSSVNDYVEEARSYQIELLEAALEDNTIVLLGTGAGKTFIAVMLIKHLSALTLLPLNMEEAKRSVFLVNTVPLVAQQAGYIEKHTGLSVGKYCGEMGVDDWCSSRWEYELSTNNILVMTRQIFLDSLSHAFIKMSKINLIVFDECHHAVKNDPYVRIMQEFYFKLESHDRPHILGLSASIISGKCKPGDLRKKLRDLEVNLDCRVAAASDLAEVAKYATNPDESFVSYGSWSDTSSQCTSVLQIKSYITQALDFLDASGQSLNRATKKDKIEKDIRAILDDCANVLDDVGVSSAKEAAELARKDLKELLEGCVLTPWERGLVTMALTHIALFVESCNGVLQSKVHCDISPKLDKLFHILDEALKTTDKLCGIVFVQKRTLAACLSSAINCRYSSNLIRSEFLVGHGTIRKMFVEQQKSTMNVKSQQQVLKRFKKESTNLLIATSVVEEGLDVRKCNLVVRYDFPLTFQSYVQSKGRARSKNSRYLLLVPEEEDAACRSRLREYTRIESELQTICHDRTVPNEDEIEEKLRNLYYPYCPQGDRGPQVAINGSLSALHKYCQKLPHDQFTASIPIFKTTVNGDGGVCKLDNTWYDTMYTVSITLPMNCPVKDVIQGPPLPRVALAKKAAALEAIKTLHKEKELDEHLKPVPHLDLDSDDEDDVKMDCKKKHNSGTTKRAMYYRNECASSLHDCQPVAECDGFLYVFVMKDAVSGHYYRSEGIADGSIQTMGILSGKPLPYHTIPRFSLYEDHDEFIVTVMECRVSYTQPQLHLYKEFHNALFNRVLRIPIPEGSITNDGTRGYLVVPVIGGVEGDHEFRSVINEGLIHYVLAHADNETSDPCIPFDERQFTNALVSKRYITEMGGKGRIRLYQVLSISVSTTPLSCCDHDQTLTYAEYFRDRYKFVFKNNHQFALKCKPISNSEKVFQLVRSRYNDKDSKEHIPILFPELCYIHPLKADMLFLFRCVPSLIHRFESFLLVNELFTSIVLETRLGLTDTNVITTITNVSSKEEPYPINRSVCYLDYFTSSTKAIFIDTIVENSTRVPDCGLLLKALTPLSANDCVNLERLELLGDSFLKLATSVNLFCSRSSHHEGRLTMARQRRISNFNLWYLARKKGYLIGKIFSQKFEPLSSWIPPGYTLYSVKPREVPHGVLSEEESKYLYHRVSDKGVADIVEALIGACIVAGGLEAGFRFFNFIDLKLDTPTEGTRQCIDVRMSTSPSQESLMSVDEPTMSSLYNNQLLIQSSASVFPQYCQAPPPSLLRQDEHSLHRLRVLLPSTPTQLTSKLGWDFRDKGLLLQALTHPSYICNNITNSYQRLEYLGDAVLDYLITCHIYESFPSYSPGKITEMRSALVNNVTFAEIAIKELQLHKYMLHSSPILFGQISEYIDWLEMVWDSDDREIKSIDVCRSMTSDEKVIIAVDSQHSATSLEESVTLEVTAAGVGYEEEVEDFEPPKALGDLLESVAGALFLDSDMSLEIVWMKFFPFFKPLIEKYSNEGLPIPPINELYERDIPIEIMESTGDSGKKFRCTIKVVDKRVQVSAVAKTKKRAKNAAAKRAVEILNNMNIE